MPDRRVMVREWLQENERSLAWLARQLGYHRVYLSRVMHGKEAFSDKLAAKLKDAVGLDVDRACSSTGG